MRDWMGGREEKKKKEREGGGDAAPAPSRVNSAAFAPPRFVRVGPAAAAPHGRCWGGGLGARPGSPPPPPAFVRQAGEVL